MVKPMASYKGNKKSMQTALYGKIKERSETGVAGLIGANIQSIPYLSILATQDKTKARKVPIDKG